MRGPGLAALSRHTQTSGAYSTLSSQLTTSQLTTLQSQIDLFSTALRNFASTHKKEILENAEFRGEFGRMCANIGVDPLGAGGSSSKVSGTSKLAGLWNDLLGLGDFNFELGVQIVDVCVSTRDMNGGVMEMEELIRRIERLRRGGTRSSRSRSAAQPPPASTISEDDVIRSIKTLAPLGCGYEVLSLNSSPGSPKIVRSLPGELSLDSTTLLSLLASPSCPRDRASGYSYLTEDFIIQAQRPMWTRQRVRNALKTMNEVEGTLWIDYDRGEVRYYSLSVGASAVDG